MDDENAEDNVAVLGRLLAASSELVARASSPGSDPRQIAAELKAHCALIEHQLRRWRESINS